MVEPIHGNTALFQKQESTPITKEREESQLEHVPELTPFFKTITDEMEHDSMVSSTEELMQVEPVFEQLPPHIDQREELEIHQTEAPMMTEPAMHETDLEAKEDIVPFSDV